MLSSGESGFQAKNLTLKREVMVSEHLAGNLDLDIPNIDRYRKAPEKVDLQKKTIPYYVYVLFFMLGVGCASDYASILFQSQLFLDCKGYSSSFVALIFFAYYGPGLPVYIFQTKYDTAFNSSYGARRATRFRVYLGQLGMVTPVVVLPLIDKSMPLLISCVLLGGICNGGVFGAISRLSGQFSPNCTGYFLLGTGSATFFLFAYGIATGDICELKGNEYIENAASRNVFYTLSGSMTLLNIVWLKILMATRTGKFFVRHTQITSKPESENEEAAPESPELEATLSSQKIVSSSSEVASQIVLPILSIFVVYFFTYLSYPMFNAFSLGTTDFFRKYIFQIDAITGFFGRQLSILRRGRVLTTSLRVFVISTFFSVGLFSVFLLAILLRMDIPSSLFIPLFCCWGIIRAYFGSIPYSLAVNAVKSDNDKATAVTLLNIVSTACLFVASIFTFTVIPTSPNL